MQINGLNQDAYKYRNQLKTLLEQMRTSGTAKSGRAQGSIVGYNGTSPIYGPKTTNTDGIEGMCITGMKPSDYKTVPVADEVRQDVIDLERKKFFSGNGMSDGEEESAQSKYYTYQQPKDNRINYGHTLMKIRQDETDRMIAFMKERAPSWKAGNPIDPKLYDEYIKSAGKSVDIKA